MPRWVVPPALLALLLLAQPLVFPAAFVAPGDPVALHYSDFRRFTSAAPAVVQLTDSAWLLPEPSQARHDGKLGVADAESLRSFSLGTLGFSATFLTPTLASGHPSRFADELVVFATSDPTTFHGFEFGVRESLADGFVYAYSQFPNPLGGIVFQEHRLFANDAQSHTYALSLVGGAISFTVDGSVLVIELFPVGPPSQYFVVATAHRASDGWNAAGLGLSVSGVSVGQLRG